jgi:hypothetical protein
MHIILNNVKVLCVFAVWGFLTQCYIAFAMTRSENYIPKSTVAIVANGILLIVLAIVVIIGNYVLHFVSGRYFLQSVNNHLINSTAFALIAVLAVIYSWNPNVYILRVLYGPSMFLRFLLGENYHTLSLFITVSLSMLMQFLGMVKGAKV